MADQLCITCLYGSKTNPSWPSLVDATTTVAGYALCASCAVVALGVLAATHPVSDVLAAISAHHP
jgi:hypothetical protein